jgi:hypothetical protein
MEASTTRSGTTGGLAARSRASSSLRVRLDAGAQRVHLIENADSALCCYVFCSSAVPGYRLCRPFGTRLSVILPGTSVPGYRLCCPFGTRLRCVILPGTSVPGYRLCRPSGTRLRCLILRHFRAGLQIVPSLRDSPALRDPTRHFRAGLQIVPRLSGLARVV